MKDVFAAIVGHMRARKAAGRNIDVFDDDVLVASFPHSGDSRFQELLAACVVTDEPQKRTEKRVPDIYRTSAAGLSALPRPRLLATHGCFDPRFKRVVYLVRDPRAVFAGWARHQAIDVGSEKEQATLAARFVTSGVDGISGTWAEHVGSWLAPRGGGDGLHLLRYEDLVADTQREMRAMASFLRLKEGSYETVVDTSARTDITAIEPDTRHSKLPEIVLKTIEDAWSPVMRMAGYEPVTKPAISEATARQEEFWGRVRGYPAKAAATQERR